MVTAGWLDEIRGRQARRNWELPAEHSTRLEDFEIGDMAPTHRWQGCWRGLCWLISIFDPLADLRQCQLGVVQPGWRCWQPTCEAFKQLLNLEFAQPALKTSLINNVSIDVSICNMHQ